MIKPTKDKRVIVYLIPTLFLGVFFIAKYHSSPVGDFGNYYYASYFLQQGNWGLWIYEPFKFNLAIYDLGQRHFFLNYTPVPPLSALLYLPLTFFSVTKAKIIWNSLSLLLFLWSLLRLCNYSKVDVRLLLLIPLLVFVPLKNNIMEGQAYLLLFFLLVEGFIQYTQKNVGLMALCWGLSIHLKISPAFILFFLCFQKDIKSFSLLVFNLFLLALVSLPVIGFDVWQNYVFKILPRLYNGEINHTYAYNYQSFQVMLKTILVPDLLHNASAKWNNSLLYIQLLMCFKIAIYGRGILFTFSVSNSSAQKFGVWLIISLLVSGYGNSFSLLLLLIPMFLFSSKWVFTDYRFILVLGLILVIANLPIDALKDLNIFFRFSRFWVLLVFFLFICYNSKVKVNPYYLILLVVPFVFIRSVAYSAQNYLFRKEEAFLVYDFKLKPKAIQISYFDINGPATKTIPSHLVWNKIQYFYTNSNPDKYASYCKLNDSLLIYLSDENRGIGFNTLRISKIKNE